MIVALYAPHLTLIDEAGCCVCLFVADYCIHIVAVSLSCVCYAYAAIVSRLRRRGGLILPSPSAIQMLMGNIVRGVD